MRCPFDPPYTQEDLEQLDILHGLVGLGEEWLASEDRCRVSKIQKEKS